MTGFETVQQRWDSFLNNIREKFHEVLSQAEAALPGLLDIQGFDTAPFANAWQGFYSQAHSLVMKIEETWHDKVEKTFEKEGKHIQDIPALEAFNARVRAEGEKGYELMHTLEKELHGYKVRTYAEAARKLIVKGKEILSKSFTCTQCQAPLTLQDNFYRSYYVNCSFCNTVNTFEPGTIARNIEHFALDALGEEAALQEYFVYFDLDRQRRQEIKGVTKETVINAYTQYVDKFLQQRMQIIPDYQSRFEADRRGKIEFLERYMQ